ncbi:MAG: ABC transporter substrate-binding protein [bacterium]|nr:ABC transporter substrate-binding protein [bacterium]
MNNKILVGVGIAIVVAAVATWKALPSSLQSQSQKELPTLRIALNPWIGNGLYYVADEKGFFKKEGLNVTLTDFADGSVGKQLISTNKIDMVSLTAETVQVLSDAGTRVKVVAVTDTSDGADGIIADSTINTLQDLRGKTVAYETGSPSHLLLSYLLDQQGMTTKDVKTVNQVAPDAGASFMAGKVDAAVTWEPWLSKAKDRKGGRLIASTKNLNLLPAIPIFRADVVDQRPEDVKKFLRAIFMAEEYIAQNPNESYGIIARRFSIKVSDVTDQIGTFRWLGLKDNLAYFDQNTPDNIYSLIDRAGDLWLKLGLIRTKTDAASIVDPGVVNNLNF